MRIGETFGRALLGIVLATAVIQAKARSSWTIDPSQTHVLFGLMRQAGREPPASSNPSRGTSI